MASYVVIGSITSTTHKHKAISSLNLKLWTFDFKLLASSHWVSFKNQSLLISNDQPILNKNEASLQLYLFDFAIIFVW